MVEQQCSGWMCQVEEDGVAAEPSRVGGGGLLACLLRDSVQEAELVVAGGGYDDRSGSALHREVRTDVGPTRTISREDRMRDSLAPSRGLEPYLTAGWGTRRHQSALVGTPLPWIATRPDE
jgi:hypothetical protein